MRRTLSIAAAIALTSSVAFGLVAHGHWAGTISGKDGMKITGTAMMMDAKEAGSTEVTVQLKGDDAGIVRPWHIHTGSCEKGGGVWGGGKSYTPITVDDKGNGMSKAMIAAMPADTGHYYVNIHESAANMSKIVACGDLKHEM